MPDTGFKVLISTCEGGFIYEGAVGFVGGVPLIAVLSK
jgi:hypothetical protein